MERMLSAASATKSSFESEFGSALEAKNAELKESTMAVQVCVNSSSAPCPCKSWELGRFQQLLLALPSSGYAACLRFVCLTFRRAKLQPKKRGGNSRC